MSTTVSAPSLTGDYTIDSVHSRIGFVVRHAMRTEVRGRFTEFEGGGYLDADEPTNSRLEITIQTASVDTGVPDRDAQLRSNDLLDSATFPYIRFASLFIVRDTARLYRVSGDLTIKGLTNALTLDLRHTGGAPDAYGNRRIGFEGAGVINRKDWGVNGYSILDPGGVRAATLVAIDVEISALKRNGQPREQRGH